jgi:hypothetical protein
VVTNADDLKGRYIVRNLEAGQFMYKSLTGTTPAEVEKAAPAAPDRPPPEVKPTERPVPIKTKYPWFEQVIQEGGFTRRVIWLEIAPGKYKRFENERDAENYQPEKDDKPSPKE